VLGRSGALISIGLGIGLLAALALNRTLASVLSEVGPLDVGVMAASAAAIVITASAACLAPALSAARLDPVRALRR